LTLPHSSYFPTGGLEREIFGYIPCLGSTAFIRPKVRARFRYHGSPPAVMTVPKASVHKDGNPMLRKNYIGFSGKILSVQAVPVAHFVEHRSDAQFWLGVAAPN
jgi:hypothetical protein